MMRVCLALIAVGTTSALMGQPPAGGNKNISIAGDWQIVDMAKNGAVAGPDELNAAFIRATATTFVAVDAKTKAEVSDSKFTYEIVNLKDINFYQIKSALGGKDDPGILPPIKIYRPGIIELKGDTLKVCFRESIPGRKDASGKIVVPEKIAIRPTDFDGSLGQFSMTLKRKAK